MSSAIETRRTTDPRERDRFQTLRQEIEYLWNQIMGDHGNRWLLPMTAPALDMSETASTIEVRVDLPGFKAEDINVELSQNVLTVSGHRTEEKSVEEKTFHRNERRVGKFSRSITLPASVVEDNVEAQYRDGVLTITLQKSEASKTRKIEVKS